MDEDVRAVLAEILRQTLAGNWRAYRQGQVPGGTPPAQVEAVEHAFYAGAITGLLPAGVMVGAAAARDDEAVDLAISKLMANYREAQVYCLARASEEETEEGGE